MIGKTLGHYAVSALLGKGGMGVLYKVEEFQLGRHVALKFMEENQDDCIEKSRKVELTLAATMYHAGSSDCASPSIDNSPGQRK